MNGSIHPAASEHLPSFITAPGETDVLMVVMSIFLLLFVLTLGILYFQLHALPERFAHNKLQLEIVCVLALLAMFTHMHIFWIAGLLIALIEFPDFSTPLNRIAGSTEKIAGIEKGEGTVEGPHETVADIKQSCEAAEVRCEANAEGKPGDEITAGLTRRKVTPARTRG